MNGYFSVDFAEVESSKLRLWLYQAQVQLPQSKGVVRELLKQGIRDCASELKYRYRLDIENIWSATKEQIGISSDFTESF